MAVAAAGNRNAPGNAPPPLPKPAATGPVSVLMILTNRDGAVKQRVPIFDGCKWSGMLEERDFAGFAIRAGPIQYIWRVATHDSNWPIATQSIALIRFNF